MIRLQTLGTIALQDAAGADLGRVVRQPKRFGLLAYLALARPRGFHRRDSLLMLFWPELDDDHGRAALRQALYTIRRSLPAGVLRSRGDEEVGLSANAVWCDVHAFEEALAEGRPAAALELYQGELLSGFHVPDAAPELDYWLSAERDRLRALALQAAWEAAAAAEQAGRVGAARRFASRGVALAPLDEEAARRQIELLHRTGDVSGALRAFDRWAERLQAELDVRPSAAMWSLVEAVRESQAGSRRAAGKRVAPQAGVSGTGGRRSLPGEPAASAATPLGDTPPATDPAIPARPRWWRVSPRRAWATAALALLVVISGVLIAAPPLRLGWQTSSAAPAVQRLMVLPFAYRGGEESAYLSEGLVYLFSVALDGAGLRSMDPHGLVRRAAADGVEEYDALSAADLAERLRSKYFLLGNVVESRGRLQITVSLYDRHGPQLVAQTSAAGGIGEVPRLVDRVAAQLLTSRSVAPASRVTRLAGVSTTSLPALKAYLEGESLLRAGAFREAVAAFEQAVLADTLFALAHYRLSLAASWAFRGELASAAAASAMRHAERLPDRERQLLAAHSAYRRGDGAAAAAALRELAIMYPDDPEVWYRLGEVLLHFGPPNGWPLADAREPFRRAVELGPLVADVHYHLAQIETALGSPSAALTLVERALEASPRGARAPQLRMLRALLSRDEGWTESVQELAREDDFTVISAVYNAAVYAGRPDRARAVAALLVAPARPAPTRAFGYLLLAELDLAQGRWGAASTRLHRLRQLDPLMADEMLALLADAPAAALTREELLGLLERLRREDGTGVRATVPWRAEQQIQPIPRRYARGRVASLLGDEAALEEAIDALRSGPPHLPFAAELAADLEITGPRSESHAGAVAGVPPSLHVAAEVAVLSPVHSRPARRFLHARALEGQGQYREALEWYESLGSFSIHDLPWAVPALVDRGRVHEALGQPLEAAALYRRFLELWADADADPHALRAAARAGLRRASSASGDPALPVSLAGRRLGR